MNKEYEYYTCEYNDNRYLYRFSKGNIKGDVWVQNEWLTDTTAWVSDMMGWNKITKQDINKLFPGAIVAPVVPVPRIKTKFVAINLLQAAGFRKINKDNDSDWNYNGLRICINPDKKITLQKFVDIIADQAAFNTRLEIHGEIFDFHNRLVDGFSGYSGISTMK